MGTQATSSRDEFGARLLSTAFITCKRHSEVSLGGSEGVGQLLGVLRSLRDSGAHMRPSNEGCVTHKDNAAKGHVRHIEIKHSGQDRLRDARDEVGKLR